MPQSWKKGPWHCHCFTDTLAVIVLQLFSEEEKVSHCFPDISTALFTIASKQYTQLDLSSSTFSSQQRFTSASIAVLSSSMKQEWNYFFKKQNYGIHFTNSQCSIATCKASCLSGLQVRKQNSVGLLQNLEDGLGMTAAENGCLFG